MKVDGPFPPVILLIRALLNSKNILQNLTRSVQEERSQKRELGLGKEPTDARLKNGIANEQCWLQICKKQRR